MVHDPIEYGALWSMLRRFRRLARLLALTCFLAYLCVASPAFAAQIVVDRDADPVIVTVVGTLVGSDSQKFIDAISGVRKAIIVFSSDGGSAIAGISIGKTIRFRNFMTAVPDGVRCASACALAWLGGTNRYMSADARIGFHAAYTSENGRVQESGVGNALIGSYLGNLGLSDAAVIYITSAHPEDIQWLTMADARRFGIDVALLPPMPDLSRSREPSPLPSPSTRSSPPTPTLEDKARVFIGRYFGRWSENNYSAMTYVQSIYSDPVDFYGKATSRRTIVDMKQKFAERWPERTYVIRWNSLTIKCDQQNSACLLNGLVDWECRSPSRGARSAGLADFSVGVLFGSNDSTAVYHETGSVVTRSAGQ